MRSLTNPRIDTDLRQEGRESWNLSRIRKNQVERAKYQLLAEIIAQTISYPDFLPVSYDSGFNDSPMAILQVDPFNLGLHEDVKGIKLIPFQTDNGRIYYAFAKVCDRDYLAISEPINTGSDAKLNYFHCSKHGLPELLAAVAANPLNPRQK